MANWFVKIQQFFFPSNTPSSSDSREESSSDAVMQNTDKPILDPPLPKSTLSPFASRLLAKARQLTKDSDEEKPTVLPPADLFMTSEDAKKRVEHIQNITLEKKNEQEEHFTQAAHTLPKTPHTVVQKKNT